ncbi:O-methylsterigmatocystin oxidoreductase [Coprinopsis sp. MPI-PUGE-AT-0042]|nr:O-methylsterigmatocystin oxidoreductase [Coprinopsis sp. MPI-PUGE-AT-0042]
MVLEVLDCTLNVWIAAGFTVAALALYQAKRAERRSRLPLPPGPKGLPLIGNLLDIPQEKPWEVYSEWAKQYGDIIHVHALGQNIVVSNTLEAANDLLTARAPNYSDRATSPVIDMTGGPWSFVLKPYNTEWRDSRRAFHRFFNHTQVPQFRPVVGDEITRLLGHLLSTPEAFGDIMKESFALIIMRVSYGSDDRQYNRHLVHQADGFIHEFMEYLKPGRLLVDVLPSLRHVPSWLPGAGWKRSLKKITQMKETVTMEPFKQSKERLVAGIDNDQGASFATKLIGDLPSPDSSDYEYRHEIARHVVSVAYLAGLDTTYASIMAIIYSLASHQEVQRKAQGEIDQVVGADRLPTFTDLDQIPYVQAIVKEVTRWHSVTPLCMPHASTNEDEYKGYRIPAGTIIMPNIWGIMHNRDYFEDPMDFKPERYLKDSKLNPEVMDPEVAAFGFGRRICPGRHFSGQALTMLVASLLSCFDIKPPKDEHGQDLPMEPMDVTSLLISQPQPFKCSFVPRSQQHAQLIQSSMPDTK